MSKHQLTGMRGVYLAAAELAGLGLVASPTSRSAAGADLLVTSDNCAKAYSVQVKTNAKAAGFWLLSGNFKETVSASHLYVLVNLRDKRGEHDFYVVPSRVVARLAKVHKRRNSTWYAIYRKDIARYSGKWRLLGAPARVSTRTASKKSVTR